MVGNLLARAGEEFSLNAIASSISEGTPQQRARSATGLLEQAGLLPQKHMDYCQKKLEAMFEAVINTHAPFARAISELGGVIDRLGNSALISAYAARLITIGMPYISSGFDGIVAGNKIVIPFESEMSNEDYTVQGDGGFEIAPSQLQGVTTDLFTPLIIVGGLSKYLSSLVKVHEHKHELLQNLAHGVRLQSEQATVPPKMQQHLRQVGPRTFEHLKQQLTDTRKALNEYMKYHQGREMMDTAFMAAYTVVETIGNAVGIFGMSLFVGAKLAEEFVGGSQIYSDDPIMANYNVTGEVLVNGQHSDNFTENNVTFEEPIETIELPNPSQITGMTMMVGGLGGALILLLTKSVSHLVRTTADKSFLNRYLAFATSDAAYHAHQQRQAQSQSHPQSQSQNPSVAEMI